MALFGKGKEQPLDPEVKPIVEAAMRVHEELGPAHGQAIYTEALAIELREHGVTRVESGLEFQVVYKGHTLDTVMKAEFRVRDNILVLVRARDSLGQRDLLELVATLKAAGHDHGMIFNFGAPQLEMRRAVAPAPTA